jgi:prepilin-type N-terminal cleavage/methylation domain-containing protein
MASIKISQRGFTLIEVLIAMTLGLILVGALVSFLLNSSQNIRQGQQQAESVSRGQQMLNRIVEDIKESAVGTPPLFPLAVNWAQLPILPYMAFELYPYADTSGATATPTTPAARKFATQVGENTNPVLKWYPNAVGNPAQSNSLVFYKTPSPGVGSVGLVERITLRLDRTDPNNGKLLREVQTPINGSGATKFQTTPVPEVRTMADGVEQIQFTYPEFERAMVANPSGLHDQLNQMVIAQGERVTQGYINQNWRKTIGIRLVMQGAVMPGGRRATGIELKTEVRLRSE